jgi:hypothetical protein
MRRNWRWDRRRSCSRRSPERRRPPLRARSGSRSAVCVSSWLSVLLLCVEMIGSGILCAFVAGRRGSGPDWGVPAGVGLRRKVTALVTEPEAGGPRSGSPKRAFAHDASGILVSDTACKPRGSCHGRPPCARPCHSGACREPHQPPAQAHRHGGSRPRLRCWDHAHRNECSASS